MFNINFANDWNQTADLWRWKQLLYQLSHTTTALLNSRCFIPEIWFHSIQFILEVKFMLGGSPT